MANLKKTKIFQSWAKAGIEYINITDLRNLNSDICSPVNLGFMVSKGYDCVTDGFKRQSPHYQFPCLLQNQQRQIDFYYPFETIRFQKKQDTPIGRYECLYTNMYTSVKHLDTLYSTKTSELFKYKIKEKRLFSDTKGNDDDMETKFSDFIDWLPEYFSFEFNAFNIVAVSNKSCILEKERSKVVLFIEEDEKEFGEKQAVYQLLNLAKEFCSKELKVDLGKIDPPGLLFI